MTNTKIDAGIAKYIAKKYIGFVEEAYKTFDGYEVVLKDGYYFNATDTYMTIEPTIKDLRYTLAQGISEEPIEEDAFEVEEIEEEEVAIEVEEIEEAPKSVSIKTNERQSGVFGYKVNTDEELEEEIEAGNVSVDEFEIVEVLLLSKAEMENFKFDFMESREDLAGKGGTNSTNQPDRDIENVWEMTKYEMEMYRLGAYRMCVLVTDGESAYAVDPQGHDYARYIAKLA